MLVEITKKKMGVVKDCDMVLMASNKYRGEQDSLGAWLNARVEPDPTKSLKIGNKSNIKIKISILGNFS